jgi:hypothetical protein
MASTYSTNLKIELIGTGEQAGTWGNTTNTNLGTALEQAVVGKADVTMSSTTVTLTLSNSNAAQNARAIYLNLTGSPGGAAVLEVPAIEKPYIVKNGSDQQLRLRYPVRRVCPSRRQKQRLFITTAPMSLRRSITSPL